MDADDHREWSMNRVGKPEQPGAKMRPRPDASHGGAPPPVRFATSPADVDVELRPPGRARRSSRATERSSAYATAVCRAMRQSNDNARPASGCRFDRKIRAYRGGALLHDHQSPPMVLRGLLTRRWIESSAIVGDGQATDVARGGEDSRLEPSTISPIRSKLRPTATC
jgi:hypothetical protein